MSYIGQSYRRVIVPLKSRLYLADMIRLCHEYDGVFRGEDFKNGILAYFDFDDKATALRFEGHLYTLYGKWLNTGVRSYTDWRYED